MLEFTQECDTARRDEYLVQMAIEGDQTALETLFAHYRPHLYRTALRLCGSPEDAEDALQDGLFSAFRHLHNFQARSQFSTWLTRIVINATLMRMRQRSRRVMISIDREDQNERSLVGTLRDEAPDPEAACLGREAFEILRRRLQTLTQRQREVLWLRGVQGFSQEEAANTLGVSVGAIKSAHHHARAKLADLATPGKDNSKGASEFETDRLRPAAKLRRWRNNAAQMTAA